MQGNALLHTKKKAKSKKFGDMASPSGRMHIDLASDVIQVYTLTALEGRGGGVRRGGGEGGCLS